MALYQGRSENTPFFPPDKFRNKVCFVQLSINPIMISSMFLVLFDYSRTLCSSYAVAYFSVLSTQFTLDIFCNKGEWVEDG